jgi:hypothetical protein
MRKRQPRDRADKTVPPYGAIPFFFVDTADLQFKQPIKNILIITGSYKCKSRKLFPVSREKQQIPAKYHGEKDIVSAKQTTLFPCCTRPAKALMLLLSKLRQISIECDWKRAIFPI